MGYVVSQQQHHLLLVDRRGRHRPGKWQSLIPSKLSPSSFYSSSSAAAAFSSFSDSVPIAPTTLKPYPSPKLPSLPVRKRPSPALSNPSSTTAKLSISTLAIRTKLESNYSELGFPRKTGRISQKLRKKFITQATKSPSPARLSGTRATR